ncbi:MAG TPA: 3-hydroxyacyl-CoA dehydrogenase family protein [Firmicutes bacterium]|nr:3-hydroxyacyl-CoA dehydrogenase family protein [Bacillota bacterium]
MINRVAVVGAGTMGHGIAQAFAMNGIDVSLVDTTQDILDKARTNIANNLRVFLEEGLITEDVIGRTLDNIHFLTDLKEALAEAQYVIEAVPEQLALKQELFRLMDRTTPESAVLSSNTSSLKLTDMTVHVSNRRKPRVMITHWYNPPHIVPLVEILSPENADPEAVKAVVQLYDRIGKKVVRVLKEIPGLVANRIQQAIAREVFWLMEHGVASPEDIDRALKFGPAFRYATSGQLEIADLGGLDIWCIVGDQLLKELDDSKQANRLLREKVAKGELGVKSGRGFFDYTGPKKDEAVKKYTKKLINQLKASRFYE